MLCKNVLKATCGLALSSMLLMACSFSAPATRSAKLNNIDSSLGYASISRMAFIGGSAVYNSDNAAASQLASGVKLPYRLGKVTKEVSETGIEVFSMDDSKEVYGFIEIADISKNAVTFNAFEYVSEDNLNLKGSYSLNLGDSTDIDGDGLADVKYEKPAYARKGQKGVRYLTFLSSKEDLNTSMFSVIPAQYDGNTYPSGLIAVNPDGRYVVAKYNDGTNIRSAVSGIVKGDFVFDAIEGTYAKVVSDASYRSARTIDDADLETDATYESFDYTFYNDEWTDNDTANALLAAIGEEPCATSEEATAKLNSLMADKNLIEKLVSMYGFEIDDELAEILSVKDELSDEDFIPANRLFLSLNFPEICPPVAVNSTEIQDVFPLLSLVISDEVAVEVEEDRAASGWKKVYDEKLKEYNTKSTAIKNEFNTYQIKTAFLHKEFTSAVKDKKSTLDGSIGIKGTFSISFSNVQCGATAAVLLQADFEGFPESFDGNKLFDLNKNFTIGVVPFNVGVTGSWGIELTLNDKTCKPSELRAYYTGLHGATVSVGANWGIRMVPWKKVFKVWIYLPNAYFEPYASAGLLNKTASLVFIETKADKEGEESVKTVVIFGKKGQVIVTPFVTVTPRIGISSNTVWIGIPLKNAIDLGIRYTPASITAFADYKFNLGVSAGVNVASYSKTWNLWNKDLYKTNLGTWTYAW